MENGQKICGRVVEWTRGRTWALPKLRLEIARDRLAELIAKAFEKPKRRIPTKPTLGAKKRRLKAKKIRGEKKALHGRVDPD